jgi:protein-S-isoprenylcysteine O-methyltransferase Ste14
MLTNIVLLLFVAIIVSLIWGRFRFFRINSGTSIWLAVTYDLAVAVQMIVTVWSFLNVTSITKLSLLVCALLYLLSLVLFWWSIVTAKSLDFAFSNHVGSIVTSGPFGLFRHPFYVSYIVAWFAGSWLFGSITLWATFLYLLTFYVISARKEERMIMLSDQAAQYQVYKNNVGMFLPRIKLWKQ